ncbi:hypothetical protein Ddye_014220 [Dipteronia dyeriana]|uniref:Uncharacterized protein n=1 Tax=Dipteronia dyeriana TaxID=168575 RepID=A0AAD9X7Q4_9ROSI|nr:hypothetical protein Ddye_014220 [Dipteronia dyeriana]
MFNTSSTTCEVCISHCIVYVFLEAYKKFSSQMPYKRWSHFSLLSFVINEKPPLPCLNILKHLRLDKELEKQWYAADMKIPNNMKTLIFEYLRGKAGGETGPTDRIPVDPVDLNFTEELGKSILAWHIATDIKYELDGEDIKRHGRAFELHCGLICQISRYMFYLMIIRAADKIKRTGSLPSADPRLFNSVIPLLNR